jgi:hypothetical protein
MLSFRNIFLISFSIVYVILFFGALAEYEGNDVHYIIFSLVSYVYLIYLTDHKSFFYENFISVFLFFGLWINFSIKIFLFNSTFPEGVGFFDYRPSSYDEVMTVCSVSFLSIIIASFIRRFLFIKTIKKLKKNVFIFNSKKFLFLFIISLLFTIFFSFINFKFSFFQRGVPPKLELNFFILNFFKWFFIIGCTAFYSYCINLYIDQTKDLPKKLIIIHVFVEFVINLSMLSRGMIFNSLSIAWGIFRKISFKRNYIFNSIYIILIILLFIISIKYVGDMRDKNKSAYDKSDERKIAKYCDESGTVVRSSLTNSGIDNAYLQIFMSRLIGIEGIMAVQSLENKGYNLIHDALKEKSNQDNVVTFFDSLKQDQRCNHTISKSITLPGIVAFLYYSGSLVFVSLSLIIITLIMCFFEKIMTMVLGNNFLFVSLIGQILAYRMWHFGYAPLNSIKLLISIFGTIILVALINKILKIK